MSLSDNIKIAVLLTYGINNPQPSSIDENEKLSSFNFNDFQFMRLTQRFNTILQESIPNASVSVLEVQGCDTVKDCISLVKKKANLE